MKILLLNSDLDNLIITLIVGVTALMFLLKWAKDKFSSAKLSFDSFEDEDISEQLKNYTFNFESSYTNIKKFGIKTKVTAFIMAAILVVIPFYEFVETLRPNEVYIFWGSCLPLI